MVDSSILKKTQLVLTNQRYDIDLSDRYVVLSSPNVSKLQ